MTFHIPVGFSERDVSRAELRAVQRDFLQGSLKGDQRALIDACLSWLCRADGPADNE